MARRGCWRVGGGGGGGTNCSSPTNWTRFGISKDGVILVGVGDNLDISSVIFSSISKNGSIGSSAIVGLDELGCIARSFKALLSDASGERGDGIGERGGGIGDRSGDGVTLRQMKDVKASDRITWHGGLVKHGRLNLVYWLGFMCIY